MRNRSGQIYPGPGADHSTLGAESAHCGPDTPKIYSVEMEDDHTYHKMKMHDNTIHHMV